MDNETYSEYLIRRLDESGVPEKKRASTLQRITGCSKQAPYNWMDGTREPNQGFSRAIDKWLDRQSQEHRDPPRDGETLFLMEDAAVPYAWDSAEKTAENYINIPFFKDLSIAAGTGSAAGDEGHNGRVIPYAKSTLKANNVPDDSAFFVPVRGRSMEPDIPDGSTVGFNKAATRIIDGEVYAVEYGGLFRVKVLYEATNNRITLHSYNEEEYPDETLPGDEVTIIGQLFSVQKVYRTG